MKPELQVRRILIVDDEPDIVDLLADIMKNLNIQADIAMNGRDALVALRQNNYQTVLCDIMMPEMTGLECLMAAQAEGIATTFVFVTGFANGERMLQAIRLGAFDFISKPFDIDEIADVTFRALEAGTRRLHISHSIQSCDPSLFSRVQKNEKMISCLRARNNLKRVK